jgi:hypothetical protein
VTEAAKLNSIDFFMVDIKGNAPHPESDLGILDSPDSLLCTPRWPSTGICCTQFGQTEIGNVTAQTKITSKSCFEKNQLAFNSE